MLNQYGPWATSIDAGGNPQLNTFWRRRLVMLVPTSQASPALSRRNMFWLAAATVLMSALPLFYSRPVAADEEKPARISERTASNGELEKNGAAAQAARRAYEATLADYYSNLADIEAVYRWSCRWMQAEGADRGAVGIQAHFDRMQALCDQVTKRHKAGAVGGDDATFAAARYYVVEAKQMLKRAKGLPGGDRLKTAKDGGAKPAEAANTSATPRHDKEIAAWQQQTWQMRIDLDAPSLVPPAVQYAIFDHDPLAAFNADIKRMHAFDRERIERAENAELKKIHRNSSMTVAWDLGFRNVTGDQLYLLISAPLSVQTMSSNGPDGKKWIVTKTVRVKGKPVCWCLPVEVTRGESIHVTLTEENAFDLDAAYEKAMKAAEEAKKKPNDPK